MSAYQIRTAQHLNMLPAVDMGLLNVVASPQPPSGVTVLSSMQRICNLGNAPHISLCNHSQPCSRGVSGVGELGGAQGHPKVTSIAYPLCGRVVLGDDD